VPECCKDDDENQWNSENSIPAIPAMSNPIVTKMCMDDYVLDSLQLDHAFLPLCPAHTRKCVPNEGYYSGSSDSLYSQALSTDFTISTSTHVICRKDVSCGSYKWNFTFWLRFPKNRKYRVNFWRDLRKFRLKKALTWRNSGHLFSVTGSSNISTADFDISSNFGVLIDLYFL